MEWRSLDDIGTLGAFVRDLLDPHAPEPAERGVARTALAAVTAELSPRRRDRWAQLRSLWGSHGPDTVSKLHRVGVPLRLWTQIARTLGPAPATEPRLVGADQAPPQGIDLGPVVEWWGAPEHPGVSYEHRLHAWGMVQVIEDRSRVRPCDPASLPLTALSPRLVWRSDGGRWQLHPLLARALAAAPAARDQPRLGDGPGFLVACIADALYELTQTGRYTARDEAALWGMTLLPVLALTCEGPPVPAARLRPPPSLGEPDYMQLLPFSLLHPRVQRTIMVLDHLCTTLMSEDYPALGDLLQALDRVPDGGPLTPARIATGIDALVVDIARRALHRRASARWNSGFGFKLFRNLLRDVFIGDAAEFSRRWDRAVHGELDVPERDPSTPSPGHLAHRLREALGTALWFPGRPPYPGGPATHRVAELVWRRWTAPGFLA
ncbi:hypothetical protein [Haliangium sp.]|uniref:hypothetical protein n=1 Tax=Haliangium sp. TaxID=2663208 RepID=UPI003D0ABFDA